MELITGHSGTPHISSADIGALLAGVVSEEKYCFGDAPVLALIDANTLSIGAAELLLNGRHIRITEPETVDIDSGTVGYYRKDLVVCRYTYDTSTRVESVEWVVVKGAPSNAEATAVDPTTEYMNTSILDGALIVDIPVVRVTLNGLTPTAACLVPEMPSMHELAQSIVDNTAAITTLQNSVGHVVNLPIMSVEESDDLNDIRAWIMRPKANCANFPSDMSANNGIVLSLSWPNAIYNAQIVFGFGADKIAIRRKNNSTTWTNWKYFNAS